jgi:universal stress protein A
MQVKTILCPIDFTDVSAQEVDIAVEISGAFGAKLVLHHNRTAIAPGLARQWDWESTHCTDGCTEPEAERRMQAILNSLPATAQAEGVVSSGPVAMVILSLAERLPVDLIVLGSRGWGTLDHASVAETLIAQAPCPVLTFNAGSAAAQGFHLRETDGSVPEIVVPTDFSQTAQRAVAYAFALARVLPLRVRVLHVLPAGHEPVEQRETQTRLDRLVPADLRERVETDIRSGRASDAIVAYLADVKPTFAVLGEHARDIVRHVFTRDTTRAVVHEASCPVWVVPAQAGP